MYNVDVSLWAILVSAVVSFVIGFLWYGPLFGKKWTALMKVGEVEMAESKNKGMAKVLGISFIATLIMSYVFAQLMILLVVFTISQAVMLAVWIWLGFIATTTINDFLFTFRPKPWALYVLNNAHLLVSLIAIAITLLYTL